ncbi:MAG: hypothetical protein WCO79_00280 [bacterium]
MIPKNKKVGKSLLQTGLIVVVAGILTLVTLQWTNNKGAVGEMGQPAAVIEASTMASSGNIPIGTMHHHSDAKDGKLGSTTCGNSPVIITARKGAPTQMFDSPANTICALSSIKLTTSDTVQVQPAGPTITGPGTFNLTSYSYNDKGTGVVVLPQIINGKIFPEKFSYGNDMRYDYAEFDGGPNNGVFGPLNVLITKVAPGLNGPFPASTCVGIVIKPFLPISTFVQIQLDDSDHDGTYNYSSSYKTTYVSRTNGRQIQCLETVGGTVKDDILSGGTRKLYQMDVNNGGAVVQTLLTSKPEVGIDTGTSDAEQMNGNLSAGHYTEQHVSGTTYQRSRPSEIISNSFWIKLDKAPASQVVASANFIASKRTISNSSNHGAQDLDCSLVNSWGGSVVNRTGLGRNACTINVTMPAGSSSVGGIKFGGSTMIGTAFEGSVIAK